jgi:hypothetical protein
MHTLAAILLVLAATVGSSAPGELERLKAQFPPHVAGPVTANSDPAVQRVFLKYRQQVNALTLETLANGILAIRREAERDLIAVEREAGSKQVKLTSAQRHASRQNAIWLKQKLLPYLNRLAQFQRGR